LRFAIAIEDKFDGVFHSLLVSGWTPVKVFTFPMNGRCAGAAVAAAAERLGVPVQLSRLEPGDLAALRAQACETLVVAGYRWRIGDWTQHLRYAVNFHPSPLPDGRGPWPLVRALREGRKQWGVSCHKLSPEFDQGAVLLKERFDLAEDESHESLDLRCQMALRRLAERLAQNLPAYWDKAKEQAPSDYWDFWTEEERALNLNGTVEQAQKQLRAFGLLGCTLKMGHGAVTVRRAVAWPESHAHAPGTLVHGNGRNLVFALADGYLGLTEWGESVKQVQAPATPPPANPPPSPRGADPK
jgi:methionyl-tRNA formyltransferase